jgi:hypothetical protein
MDGQPPNLTHKETGVNPYFEGVLKKAKALFQPDSGQTESLKGFGQWEEGLKILEGLPKKVEKKPKESPANFGLKNEKGTISVASPSHSIAKELTEESIGKYLANQIDFEITGLTSVQRLYEPSYKKEVKQRADRLRAVMCAAALFQASKYKPEQQQQIKTDPKFKSDIGRAELISGEAFISSYDKSMFTDLRKIRSSMKSASGESPAALPDGIKNDTRFKHLFDNEMNPFPNTWEQFAKILVPKALRTDQVFFDGFDLVVTLLKWGDNPKQSTELPGPKL